MKITLDIETVKPTVEEWAALQVNQAIGSSAGEGSSGIEYNQWQKDYDRSALDGTFGHIVCIGMLVFSDDMMPSGAMAWYGSNERGILEQFWSRVSEQKPKLIITHNGLGFDLPFIRKRSVIHRVKPTMEVNLARFRTEPVYDTMTLWANWDSRNFVKLDVLARALGVETKSGSWDEVAQMWANGEWERLAEYCLQDAYVAYACDCRMTYQDPIASSLILAKKDLYQVT